MLFFRRFLSVPEIPLLEDCKEKKRLGQDDDDIQNDNDNDDHNDDDDVNDDNDEDDDKEAEAMTE